MQKEERILLNSWLDYHTRLFGAKNIFLYNNGSESSELKSVIQNFSEMGINVENNAKNPEAFADKGNIFTRKLLDFKLTDQYDVALLLDCDEFVVIDTAQGPSCDKAMIMSELSRIWENRLMAREPRPATTMFLVALISSSVAGMKNVSYR